MLKKTLTDCRAYVTLEAAQARLDGWGPIICETLPAEHRPSFRVERIQYFDRKGVPFCTRYIPVADFTGINTVHEYTLIVLTKQGITPYSSS